jgi:hypothetical protein
MAKYLLLAGLLPCIALAEPARTDPDPNVTVFTGADGAHIVTLVQLKGLQSIYPYINEKELGNSVTRNPMSSKNIFWIRTRFVDGRLICEKFARRPKGDAEIAERAAQLFKESCS